jgi:hypothetical protein
MLKAMEKLAAGFEKQKVVCVTNSKRKEKSCSWKNSVRTL